MFRSMIVLALASALALGARAPEEPRDVNRPGLVEALQDPG